MNDFEETISLVKFILLPKKSIREVAQKASTQELKEGIKNLRENITITEKTSCSKEQDDIKQLVLEKAEDLLSISIAELESRGV